MQSANVQSSELSYPNGVEHGYLGNNSLYSIINVNDYLNITEEEFSYLLQDIEQNKDVLHSILTQRDEFIQRLSCIINK